MKQRIHALLSEALPTVDFESDFLFSELDSLNIVNILMILSDEFGITLDASVVTPKNFKTLDALVALVQSKLDK